MKAIIFTALSSFLIGLLVANFCWNPKYIAMFDKEPTMRIYAPHGYEIQFGFREHWTDSDGRVHCGLKGTRPEDSWYPKLRAVYNADVLGSNYSELAGFYFRKQIKK